MDTGKNTPSLPEMIKRPHKGERRGPAYPQPKQGKISWDCRNNKHGSCKSLSCACPHCKHQGFTIQ